MLHPAQLAIGAAAASPTPAGSRPAASARCSNAMLPTLGISSGCAGLGQHQELHRELGIDHAARAVLDVETVGLDRMRGAHLLAHRDDLGLAAPSTSRGAVMTASRTRVEALRRSAVLAQHEARPRHGLVLPGPGGVAAAPLLVVVVGLEGGDQQARAAVGAQRGVDLEQVALGASWSSAS